MVILVINTKPIRLSQQITILRSWCALLRSAAHLFLKAYPLMPIHRH